MTRFTTSFDTFLEEREDVWELKRNLASEKRTVISLTMNVPFELRYTELERAALDRTAAAMQQWLDSGGIRIAEVSCPPVWVRVFITEAEAEPVKRLLVAFEASDADLRIADADVMASDGRQVSRTELGLEPRRCFLCARDAKECIVTERHSRESVIRHASQILERMLQTRA